VLKHLSDDDDDDEVKFTVIERAGVSSEGCRRSQSPRDVEALSGCCLQYPRTACRWRHGLLTSSTDGPWPRKHGQVAVARCQHRLVAVCTVITERRCQAQTSTEVISKGEIAFRLYSSGGNSNLHLHVLAKYPFPLGSRIFWHNVSEGPLVTNANWHVKPPNGFSIGCKNVTDKRKTTLRRSV